MKRGTRYTARNCTRGLIPGAVAVVSLAIRVQAQCQYRVTVVQPSIDCDPFPPSPTYGRGINESAQVAGSYTVCAVGNGEAFLWDGGPDVITLVRPPGVGGAGACDINDAGLIVGQMSVSGVGTRAFLHDGTQFINLGTLPGGNLSRGRAINSLGQIVGVWGNNVTGDPALAAFLWQDGVMMDVHADLGTPNSEAKDINDAGQVVGWMGNAMADAHAFIWQDGAVTDLGVIPGGFTAVASAINNRNQVVGSGRVMVGEPPSITTLTFLWDGNAMANLGTLPGFEIGGAADINDVGQIVGSASGIGGNPNIQAAFIWQNGVMTNLNDLIPASAGIHVTWATAINNQGQITGRADAAINEIVGVLLTPIQLPGDLDGDCSVGIVDFLMLLAAWGPCPEPCPPSCAADLDGDCNVGITDVLMLLASWG